jgi:hypothetical protein
MARELQQPFDATGRQECYRKAATTSMMRIIIIIIIIMRTNGWIEGIDRGQRL